MAAYDVGELIAVDVDSHTRAIGVLTDRDVAIRCVARGLDPDNTRVADVMTAPVQAVSEHVPVEEALSRMAGAGTRRLVVTGETGAVVGVLTLDDVLAGFARQTQAIGRLLERQQPRIPA
jgi:CBS domain-containing protein